MSTKLNAEHLMLLEQATLKAPVETLRRIQKTAQKTYEYNLGPTSAFSKELNDLLAKTSSANPSTDDSRAELLKSVESALSKMRGLKRKLSDLSAQSATASKVASTRLAHLAAVPTTIESPEYPAWARRRLSYHLTDYFLRSTPPLKKSAMSLAEEEGIEGLVDSEIWEELAKAENGLRAGRLEEVLSWVGENRSALKKAKSPLEFNIHLQAFIELCRARSLTEAIAYGKKHLSPAALMESSPDAVGVTPLDELSRAMGLLAFPPGTTCRVYKDLYAPSRWTCLLSLFRSTFLSLHSLPALPLLHLTLQAGLASLKTPICCPIPSPSSSTPIAASSDGTTEGRPSLECPICSSPLKVLADEVPYSHHVNSTIVCGISGKVVEGGGGETGGLVAMVEKGKSQGRVYSLEALLGKAEMHPQEEIVDPQTGQIYAMSELRKVFIS